MQLPRMPSQTILTYIIITFVVIVGCIDKKKGVGCACIHINVCLSQALFVVVA